MDSLIAKNQVIEAGHRLVHSGLIARTWGNVSCRINNHQFAITPSGRDYMSLTPDDIVVVQIDTLLHEGHIKPSSEKGIHAAVYQLHPNINFVIHTHQENGSALSACDLDSFHPSDSYPELGGLVPYAKYALPGSKALCANVTAAMKQYSSLAFFLRHHGILCFGHDYNDTFQRADALERACGDQIQKLDPLIQIAPSTSDVSKKEDHLKAFWESSNQPGVILLNQDPDVLRYSNECFRLKPLLDDFAQIIGVSIRCISDSPAQMIQELQHQSAVLIKGLGAVCYGIHKEDAEAVRMILRKNCKAYYAAKASGKIHYIPVWESFLMRQFYLKKYSQMAKKNK